MSLNDSDAICYSAMALQVNCHAVNHHTSVESSRAAVMENVKRICAQVMGCKNFVKFFQGTDLKLVALPEFAFTGFPFGQSHALWQKMAAFEHNGPEFDVLSKTAQDAGLYLAGNAYEVDPNFPEIYFQTNFIIAPNGDIILRYRRLTSAFEPTPHDVWDKYLDIYGMDGMFPVAKTDIGNLACIASEEVNWPEMSRLHVLRGAEILIHPNSEPGVSYESGRDLAKRTRAYENMAYFISPNTSNIDGSVVPAYTCTGLSKIVDYTGRIMAAAADGGESQTANAVLEINALRRYRRRIGMANLLARQPVDLYAAAYAAIYRHPGNCFLKEGEIDVPEEKSFYRDRQAKVIAEMEKKGWI